MGYKSRSRSIHNPDNRRETIGQTEGENLTVKQLNEYIANPVYCGVIVHKWTDRKPILGQFEGLVTIDLFNKANRGKVTVIKDGDNITILKGSIPMWQQKKNHNNPLFPYRDYILCPVCKKNVMGSSPVGKAKKAYPGYDCNRHKPYFRVPMGTFEEEITKFVREVKFTDSFKKKFRTICVEELEKFEKETSDDTVEMNKRLIVIEQEIESLKTKIKMLSLPETIKMFEEDIVQRKLERAELIEKRGKKENLQVKLETRINETQFYIEHLHELILGGDDKAQNAAMFGLLFEEIPTYEEIITRTPKLACIYALNELSECQKNSMYAWRDSNPQPSD